MSLDLSGHTIEQLEDLAGLLAADVSDHLVTERAEAQNDANLYSPEAYAIRTRFNAAARDRGIWRPARRLVVAPDPDLYDDDRAYYAARELYDAGC